MKLTCSRLKVGVKPLIMTMVSTLQWVRCSNSIALRWETSGDAALGTGVTGKKSCDANS